MHKMKNEVGNYRMGLFYSSSMSGIPYDIPGVGGGFSSYLSSALGLGVSKDNIPETIRIVTLLHESIHYIQDLSSGMLINRDLMLDELAEIQYQYLRNISKNEEILLPIITNKRFHEKISKQAISVIEEKYLFLDTLFNGVCTVDTHGIFDLPAIIEINTKSLLEGIACIKTLLLLPSRIKQKEDLEYLKKIKEDISILPDSLPEVYSTAYKYFCEAIGSWFFEDKKWKERDWPYDTISPSEIKFLDMAFIHIAEIALHIPPFEYIIEMMDEYDIECFIPSIRFVKMINEIIKYRGFPDLISNDLNSYHGELFDWFAEKLGWPNYLETQGGWEVYQKYLRDQVRGTMSDGYRYRIILERSLRSKNYLYGDPQQILMSQTIPTFHSTPTGFKIFQNIPNILNPKEEIGNFFVEPWDYMLFSGKKWINTKQENNLENNAENITQEMLRWPDFLQEVIFRSMCRSFQNAIYNDTFLTCPWSEGTCSYKNLKCEKIKSLKDLPIIKCALREYIKNMRLIDYNFIWK